jgi:hypothetical protein
MRKAMRTAQRFTGVSSSFKVLQLVILSFERVCEEFVHDLDEDDERPHVVRPSEDTGAATETPGAETPGAPPENHHTLRSWAKDMK